MEPAFQAIRKFTHTIPHLIISTPNSLHIICLELSKKWSAVSVLQVVPEFFCIFPTMLNIDVGPSNIDVNLQRRCRRLFGESQQHQLGPTWAPKFSNLVTILYELNYPICASIAQRCLISCHLRVNCLLNLCDNAVKTYIRAPTVLKNLEKVGNLLQSFFQVLKSGILQKNLEFSR